MYLFRIRPIFRGLVLLFVLLAARDFFVTATQTHMSAAGKVFLVVCFLFLIVIAYLSVRGFCRMLGAYGRTWIG